MLTNVVFRCPNTGMNVQQTVDHLPQSDGDIFAPIQCPACVRIHFVNRKTMKLLGRHES